MEKAELKDLFKIGVRRRDAEKECNCYPNQLWRLRSLAVLVCFESQSGPDWPVGERGLIRIRQSVANNPGKITNGYVAIAQRDDIYINHETLGNIERFVRGTPPKEYNNDFGPCWFFDREFNLVLRSSNRDDHPF